MKFRSFISTSNFIFLCLPTLVGAQVTAGNTTLNQRFDLSSQLSIVSVFDDDALRAVGDQEPLEEIQNTAALSVAASYAGALNSLDLDYRMLREQFNQGSRVNNTTFTGRGSYALGNDNTIYDIEIDHTVDRVLTNPEDEFFLADTLSQRVFSSKAGIKSRNLKVDQIHLDLLYGQSSIGDADISDGVRRGIEFDWSRDLPSIYHMGVVLNRSEFSFSDNEVQDYDSYRAELKFGAESRNLAYNISIGQQKIDRKNTDLTLTEEIYSIEIVYDAVGGEFTYRDSLALSNTSFGDASAEVGTGISLGGAVIQDNVKQKTRELAWATQLFCSRCTFGASVSSEQSRFVTVVEESFSTITAAIAFDFEVSAKSTVGLGYSYRDTEIEFDQDRNSEDSIFSLNYTREISRKVVLNSFIEKLERADFEGEGGSNRVALQIVITVD